MFKTRQFLIDQFGTPDKLFRYLRARRMRGIQFHAVYKWFERDSIPGHHLARLLAFLHADQDQAVDLRPYFKK